MSFCLNILNGLNVSVLIMKHAKFKNTELESVFSIMNKVLLILSPYKTLD